MPLSPRTLRPASSGFNPRQISGLALWLDGADASSLYTTDAGPVSAVSSPTEISGCALWLDGADSSSASMTLDGTAVSSWRDKSGNGRDFAASGTARPTLTASGLNGRSVVTFDGTDDQLTNPANVVGFSSVTMFAVVYRQAGAYGGIITSTSADASPALIIENNNIAVRGHANVSLQPGGFSGPAVACGRVSSGATDIFTNGLVRDSDAASGSLGSVTTTAIGTYRLAAANYLNGYIAELIVYPTALSTADRARVEAYLAAKWGISGVHAQATATSDPVGYWADKSGNGRHLTQGIAASRPTLNLTGISSKPALNFDGTDDNIWRQPGLTSDDLSILMVHQQNSLTGGIAYEFSHGGDTTNAQAQNLTGFANIAGFQVAASGLPTYAADTTRSFASVDLQGRSGAAGDITANVPHVASQCASYSATASAVRKQAWASGRGMAGTNRFNCGGWSNITLGARRNNQAAGGINSPSVFLNGRIAEVIAYSRYLPDRERRRLELYLARKWSVTLAGAPVVSNVDAQDWIDRVYGNGGTVSASTASAVNEFCNAIDGAGIRDRFFRLNLFAGTGLNACLVPLYTGPTSLGIKYGGAVDTNVGPFVSGDYNETGASGGLQGNGTTKRLDTGLPGNALATSSRHLSAYEIQVATTDYSPSLKQFTSPSTHWHLGPWTALNDYVYAGYAGVGGQPVALRQTGHFFGQNTSSTAAQIFRNGSPITSFNTGTAASSVDSTTVTVLGATGEFSEARLGGYSIGLSMTNSQVAAYYAAMQAFQTALSRNV
jgi:hypothetical protein